MQVEQSESFVWADLFASNTTTDQSSTEKQVPQRILAFLSLFCETILGLWYLGKKAYTALHVLFILLF